jgi:hypothetical protein
MIVAPPPKEVVAMPTPSERYQLAVDDEIVQALVAAIQASEHAEQEAQEAIAKLERIVQRLLDHLPLEDQLAASRMMFGIGEDD